MKAITNIIKVGLVTCLLLGVGINVTSQTYADHTDISTTVHEYERLIGEGRYNQANSLLQQHKQELTELVRSESPGYIQDKLLTIIDQNLHLTEGNSYQRQDLTKASLQLLLAVDAINNPENPIWQTWKQELDQSISEVVSNEEQVVPAFHTFITNWEIIQPAMALSISEDKMTELDQSMQNIKQQSSPQQQKEQLTSFYNQSIKVSEVDQSGSNFIWMLSVVGGFIISTLSYVGWKKYKGERNKRQVKKIN